MAKRVAILGCGYVGMALGRSLASVRHDVVGTTTTPARVDELREAGIHPVVLDLADTGALAAVLADRDAIYLTIAPKARGANYRDVYLASATNLVAAVRATPVRRMIYTSSTRVYGQDDGSWVDESSPTRPTDDQGRALLEAERVLLDTGAMSACRTTVVRLCGIYGPGREPAARIRALAGTVREDGDVHVNMIHLDDIVVALQALLDVDHHGAVNLGDDVPMTRRAYYDRVLAAAELPAIEWRSPCGEARRGKRIRNERIKALLSLSLRHPAR